MKKEYSPNAPSMSWGGRRKGAGRPRTEQARVSFRCELPKDAADILKRQADKRGQTRTAFLAELLRNCEK